METLLSTRSGSIMLNIPSLHRKGSACFGTSTGMLVWLATSMSSVMFRRAHIIPLAGIRFSRPTTASVCSTYSNPVPFDRTLTVPKSFGFRHVSLATHSSFFALVAFTFADPVSETFALLTLMCTSDVFGPTIETG